MSKQGTTRTVTPSPEVRENLEEYLRQLKHQAGEVFRVLEREPDLTDQQVHERTNRPPDGTIGWVSNARRMLAMLLEGEVPAAATFQQHLRARIGDIRRWDGVRPDTAAHLDTMLEAMESSLHVRARHGDPYGEIVDLLRRATNVVLEGVPGSGKSFAIERVEEEWSRGDGSRALVVLPPIVMHPSTTYEDLIEGLRPSGRGGVAGQTVTFLEDPRPRPRATAANPDGSAVTPDPPNGAGFEVQDGLIVTAARQALEDPDRDYLLVLDELNRANVPKVLGDLLLTLEASKRSDHPQGEHYAVQLMYSRRTFWIPTNLFVLATLNTTDRSIAPIDAAIRRRFVFYRLEPTPRAELLEAITTAFGWSLDACPLTEDIEAWSWLNEVLRAALGPDAVLGQSYLWDAAKLCAQTSDPLNADLVEQIRRDAWQYNMLPQVLDTLLVEGVEDLFESDALSNQPKAVQNAANSFTNFLAERGLRIELVGVGLGRRPLVLPMTQDEPAEDARETEPTNPGTYQEPPAPSDPTA